VSNCIFAVLSILPLQKALFPACLSVSADVFLISDCVSMRLIVSLLCVSVSLLFCLSGQYGNLCFLAACLFSQRKFCSGNFGFAETTYLFREGLFSLSVCFGTGSFCFYLYAFPVTCVSLDY